MENLWEKEDLLNQSFDLKENINIDFLSKSSHNKLYKPNKISRDRFLYVLSL